MKLHFGSLLQEYSVLIPTPFSPKEQKVVVIIRLS